MPRAIIESNDYDLTISRTAKYAVAIVAQLLSWAIWFLWSTPATIEFCRNISPNIKVMNIYSGVIMGVMAGVTFSIGEMLFTYLWLWKRNNFYFIFIAICMSISILAMTGFVNIGHQQANIKVDTIASAEMAVNNIQSAIEQEKKQYNAYDREENYFRDSRGYVPGYVSQRRRETQERITSLSAQLNQAIERVAQLKQETGAIVTIDSLQNNSKLFKLSNLLAVILEFFIIILLVISNALWKNADSKGVTHDKESVTSVPESVTQKPEKVYPVTPLTPQIAGVTGNTSGHTKGNTQGNTRFGFQVTGDTPKKPSKLQQKIIEVYEAHEKIGEVKSMNIAQLAKDHDRSRKFIYQTLHTYTNFKARKTN